MQRLHSLTKLSIQNNKVDYKTETEDMEKGKACTVQVQKETKDGMVDAACGETTIKGHAGFCKYVRSNGSKG